jgi:peroxiredoxin
MARWLYFALLISTFHSTSNSEDIGWSDGSELVGQKAPRLALRYWINTPPLEIGKTSSHYAVLVHWWTDTCQLCAASVPAFQKLQDKYGSQGLRGIGVFFPNPPGDWDLDRVRQAARTLGFRCPLALDGDWDALDRWWLYRPRVRRFMSVTFLIDSAGTIQFVHPGGEIHSSEAPGHEVCNRGYKQLEKHIRALLESAN